MSDAHGSQLPVPPCVECRYFREEVSSTFRMACMRPYFDPVTGDTVQLKLSCRDERNWRATYPQSCSREGKYFVDKPDDFQYELPVPVSEEANKMIAALASGDHK